MLFWHAVIKPSPRLTAYHLFTAHFNFPDSLFPPNSQSISTISLVPSGFLSSFIPYPPFYCHSSSLSPPWLSGSPISQSLDPVNTSNSILSWDTQLQWLPIFCCSNPFILSSFIFVYLLRPGGAAEELPEHLSNVVCDLLNLASGVNLKRQFFRLNLLLLLIYQRRW